MKRLLVLLSVLLLMASAASAQAASEPKDLTIMIYMCGSNLESEYGSASADLQEMLDAGCDFSRVNVLVMAGGARSWQQMPIEPGALTILQLTGRGMRNVWKGDAADMGEAETLTHLLRYGVENFPARDHALILWNHGGGPLAGLCWDELFSMDNLTLSELTEAIAAARLPDKLSWIGFDACLMGSAEVASALADHAEYMIASQETEPATGWNYRFLRDIAVCRDGAEAGQRIIEAYFEGQEDTREILTLSCIDLSRMDDVVDQLNGLFSRITPTQESFASLSDLRGAAVSFGSAIRSEDNTSYDLVDLNSLISGFRNDTQGLRAALDSAVVCTRATEAGANGLSVYHPYVNKQRYQEQWSDDYTDLDFSASYEEYIRRFGALLTGSQLADWSGLTTAQGPDEDGAQVFSLQLTEEQAANLASAQLMILQPTFGYEQGVPKALSPVSVESTALSGEGILTGRYSGRALCVTDDEGRLLTGPIGFLLSEDGQTYSVLVTYHDYSARYASRNDTAVLYHCSLIPGTDELSINRTYVFDWVSGAYTNRIPFTEDGFTMAAFQRILRLLPEGGGELPAFDEWNAFAGYYGETVSLPQSWHLRFFDGSLIPDACYAMFQITDDQQNTWSSQPIRFELRHGKDAAVYPGSVQAGGLTASLSVSADPVSGLHLKLTAENLTDGMLDLEWPYNAPSITLNGTRAIPRGGDFDPSSGAGPGESLTYERTLSGHELRGLEALESVEFTIRVRKNGSYTDAEDVSFRFDVRSCDLNDLAEPMPEALAEAEDRGVTWQLTDLYMVESENRLHGEMYVENGGGTPLELSLRYLADDVLLYGTSDVYLPMGVGGFMEFDLQNYSAVSTFDMNVPNARRLYLAGTENPLAQMGVTEIHTIEILKDLNSGGEAERIPLALKDPYILPDRETVIDERIPLITGGIQVDASSAFIADDGMAIGLYITNNTDSTAELRACAPSLDGGADDSFSMGDMLLLPAHAKACEWLILNTPDRAPGETAGSLRFLLRNGDFMQQPITIGFPEGFCFGQPEGLLCRASELTAAPTEYAERPFALSERVPLVKEEVRLILLDTLLSEEELAETESAEATLCLADAGSGAIDADTALTFIATTRILPNGEGGSAAAFSGLALQTDDGILWTFETLLKDVAWNITTLRSVYFFSRAEDFEALGEILPESREGVLKSWLMLTARWNGNGLDLEEKDIWINGSDASMPSGQTFLRHNFTVDELALAVQEQSVYRYAGFDEGENGLSRQDTLKTRLLADPVTVSAVPASELPGRLCLRQLVIWPDGRRTDTLLDAETGEILLEYETNEKAG